MLGFGVRDDACDAFDRALLSVVSKIVCLYVIMRTHKCDNTAPAKAVVQSDREQLRRRDVRSEIVKLSISGQWMQANDYGSQPYVAGESLVCALLER